MCEIKTKPVIAAAVHRGPRVRFPEQEVGAAGKGGWELEVSDNGNGSAPHLSTGAACVCYVGLPGLSEYPLSLSDPGVQGELY